MRKHSLQSAESHVVNGAMASAVAPDARLQAMFAHLAELDLLGGAEQAKALNAVITTSKLRLMPIMH